MPGDTCSPKDCYGPPGRVSIIPLGLTKFEEHVECRMPGENCMGDVGKKSTPINL